MVRVRKLVLAIAAASTLTSGMAHALGLGDITLKSALNQPLDAEISLLDVKDLETSEVLPKLASPEDFNKAGVDRQYFLTDLKFTPVIKPNGQSVIRVTSSKPVREPYLNFLVEVLWPNGRLLREYTLLLDPPLYSPEVATAVAPQLPVAAPAPRLATTQAVRPAAPVASRPVAPARSRIAGNEYRTNANDTLWQIAERTRSVGSVHQTMLAIQDLNPDAFLDGNINRLKRGQVLRLPDEQQVLRRSQSEAIAQVAAQNAAWREGRSLAGGSARQLDATHRAAAGAAPAQAPAGDSLKLVAADAKVSDKGAAGDAKVLNDKLAVTQESLDTTRRENEELKSRMSDLQSQLDKLQQLIELKNAQLAKLQADLANEGQAAADEAAAPDATEQPAAQLETAQAAAEQLATPASQPEQAKAPAEEPDYNYSEEPAAQPAGQSAAPQAEPAVQAPAEQPKPEEKTSAPAPVAEESQPSFVDDLLANPMLPWIAGGSGLLVLLILLMTVSRRNAQKEQEHQQSLAAQGSEDADFASDLDLPESTFEGLEPEAPAVQAATVAEAASEQVTAQTSDVLAEADIYIAYGRFNQAAELLQNAINDEPNRSDLRLKLMEVQAELGDRDGFQRQEQELREIGGANAEIEQLKSRYPAMAAVAAAAASAVTLTAADAASFNEAAEELNLDDLSFDEEPAAPQADEEAFGLSLDDLAAELESDLSDTLAEKSSFDFDLGAEHKADGAALADSALDFDLELSETPAASAEATDFGLDLDVPAAALDDEFALSLDDDLAAEPKAEEGSEMDFELPEVASDLPADFDLSLGDEVASSAESEPVDFAAQLEDASAELAQLEDSESVVEAAPAALAQSADDALGEDDDFDFLSGTDETATKLDLARAYIDMGDMEGARDILDEVLAEGNDGQQQEARELIARLV